MHFHVLTLLPEVIDPYVGASILGRAQEKGILQVTCHQLRTYAKDKHKSVDDRPYGGGSGMVFRPEVVVEAVRDLKNRYPIDQVILLSPRGCLLTHQIAGDLARFQSPLLICGRYEGIDQRAIDLVVDQEISIGDYVITGGELAALVVIDAVARLIPEVVGNEEGPAKESHAEGLLEHPHYTRPPVYEGLSVPEVLLSGNHPEVEKWRRKESLRITQERRSELLESAPLTLEEKRFLKEIKPDKSNF